MLSEKNLDNIIFREIDELSFENKEELLRYIEGIKTKETKKTIEILNKTAGSWKNIVDVEKLKKDIYADRLIFTRPKVTI